MFHIGMPLMRTLAYTCFAVGLLSLRPAPLVWALGAVLLVAVLLGAPVFVAMGGFGLLLFFITLGLNIISQRIVRRFREVYE